jgi:uncharacterized delta-60 repeat protein
MTRLRPSSHLTTFRATDTPTRRARRSARPDLEAMEARTLLSSGKLDAHFGYQGLTPTQAGSSSTAVYPDGRILVAGSDADLGSTFVYRYSADGQVDPTFGSLGAGSYPGGDGSSVALEPDGRIAVLGGDGVAYFNPDGTLDTTFNVGVDINVEGQSVGLEARALAALPDGGILVAGRVDVPSNYFTCLAMFLPNGTLDPSFSGDGALAITSTDAYPDELEVANDEILVLSSDNSLREFNFDGSLNTTFGTGGTIDLNALRDTPGFASFAVQPNGKILISGQVLSGGTDTDVIVARDNADGSPDQSFGASGQTTLGSAFFLNEDYVTLGNVAIQPNGKILLATEFVTYLANGDGVHHPQLLRLNTNGSVDTTFGAGGLDSISLPDLGLDTSFSDIAVQPSGRIIGLGTSGYNTNELVGIVGDPVVAFGGATSVDDSGAPTAVYDVSETAGSSAITLQRGGDLSQTLSVPFSTDDSGGLAGVNYTSVNTTVTFAAGSSTATVGIPILNDPNASGPIDVALRLGTPSGGAILGSVAVGDLRIIPVEGIVITPTRLSSVMQGGAGSSFTVALQSGPTANVTVPLSISATGTAATLSTDALVFTPANALMPQTVTVTPAGGSGSTAPAMATVSVGPATSTDPKYNRLAGSSANVTVYSNNASSPGWIEFAAANFTYDEDAGTATIMLVRLGGSQGSASVHFATSDGTSGAAGKYTPLMGSISFASGVTSRQFTITLVDPGHKFQGDQTVDLSLSNPTGGVRLGAYPTATLTLHDTSQLEAGDLDPTFGTDGKVILTNGGGDSFGDNIPTAIASQPDGKLVIAGTGGTVTVEGNYVPLVRVWRTDASGQPDPSFGRQGVALIPFPNFGQVKAVAVAPDGKIVVDGNAASSKGADEFALLRLDSDGTLDTSFGTNGLVTTSFSAGTDIPSAISIEADGSILVAGVISPAGDATQPLGLAHYGPDGSVDIGFGNGGALVIQGTTSLLPGASLLKQPDGKWLLIGGGSNDLPGFAVRLDSDFSLDPTFGTSGIAELPVGSFYESAALAPNGDILIGGGSSDAIVDRLNPDGTLDTTFGSGGGVVTVFRGADAGFGSLFVEPDGRILAVGFTLTPGLSGSSFVIEARYLSNGSPDPSFASGGSGTFGISTDGNDQAQKAITRLDGRIVLASQSDGLPVLVSILTAPPGQKIPDIAWADPANINYGMALGATQLDATASWTSGGTTVNVPGSFTYTPAAGTVVGAGDHQTLSVSFTPTDTNDYADADKTATINVLRATPTITWANPADIVYGTPLGATQLDATSSWTLGGTIVSVPGNFTYTPAAGTVLGVGNHQTLSVSFTPTDTTDYADASATTTINVVVKRTPTITWANPASKVYGPALGAAQFDATASVPGTFAYFPDAGTVLTAGSHTLSVTFTPSDSTDYETVTDTTKLVVTPATPTITWANPADIVKGTPLGGTQLDAMTSWTVGVTIVSVPGNFTYTPAARTVLGVGKHQALSVSFTPTDTTDYALASATATINVLVKITPTITWANPPDIIYGTALGAAQLDATANVPGTFAYSQAVGTVLHAGSNQTLSAIFTPTDTTDYIALTANASINVEQATPIITWNPAPFIAGSPLGPPQLDAKASVPGTFAYSPEAGTVLHAGSQSLSLTFTPTDAVDYVTGTVSTAIMVAQAVPSVTWANPADIAVGTPLSATQLDATASVPGTFSYTPAAGNVLNAGANQTLAVTFTPNDAIDYASVTAYSHINVNASTPPAVTVIGVQVLSVHLTKKKIATDIIIAFSSGLNVTDADILANYHIAAPGKGKKSKIYSKPITLKSAVYSSASDRVTIQLNGTLALSPPPQLRITAAGILDNFGRALDGNHDGQPGGDYVALLTRGGARPQVVRGPEAFARRPLRFPITVGVTRGT